MINVAILGASANPSSYAYLVQQELMKQNYSVFPINPNEDVILGKKVLPSLKDLISQDFILTLYLSPKRLKTLISDIIEKSPKIVIFNPGTEFKQLQAELTREKIPWLEVCSLVLLKTKQFSSILEV